MRLIGLIVLAASCLSLTGCLTAYQPVADGGATAQLKLSSPTYSSSLLSAANLTLSVYRVDDRCNFKHLGWIKYDPQKNGESHALAADTIAWLSVSYNAIRCSRAICREARSSCSSRRRAASTTWSS